MKFFPLGIALLAVLAISCTGKSKGDNHNDTRFAIEQNIEEITQNIESGNWEQARMTAETTSDAYADDLTALEAAKMTVIYISLASEPQSDTNFEKFYNYAKRIVQFHDLSMRLDGELSQNYYKTLGAENIIKDAYDNAIFIIQAKNEAGMDSTYIPINNH